MAGEQVGRSSPPCLMDGNSHQIPKNLAEVYRESLNNKGLLEKASIYKSPREIYGGAGDDESEQHYCFRFLNSASRLVRVLIDFPEKFPEITKRSHLIFSSGRIALLDIPCGTGAGSLALLSSLAELRKSGATPSTPITVTIYGGDISSWSRQVFSELSSAIAPKLLEAGIKLHTTVHHWDASEAKSMAAICDEWLANHHADNDYFVLVSNFSGSTKSVFESFGRSFSHLGERMARYPATLLWVESGSSFVETIKTKIRKFLSHIKLIRQIHPTDEIPQTAYKWDCPITGSVGINSQVSIPQFVETDKTNAR